MNLKNKFAKSTLHYYMAHRYGHEHTVIAGIVAGMLVMAFGLLMF